MWQVTPWRSKDSCSGFAKRGQCGSSSFRGDEAWGCQENTDGLKVCPKILLMEEILHHQGWWLSHCLQSFNHLRWCRISSINRSTKKRAKLTDIMISWHIVLGTLHTLRPCRSFRQIRVRWRIRTSALAFLKKVTVSTLRCLREVLLLMPENPHDRSWVSWKTIPLEMMEQTTVLQLIKMDEVWLEDETLSVDALSPYFLPCHYLAASFVIAWLSDNVIVSWKYPLKSTYSTVHCFFVFSQFPPVKCEGVYCPDRSLSDVPVPSVTEGKLDQQAKQMLCHCGWQKLRWRLRRLADLSYFWVNLAKNMLLRHTYL